MTDDLVTRPPGNRIVVAIAAFVAMAAFPATLLSAGATVGMALTALYGVVVIAMGVAVPANLRRVHWFMTGCYLVLVLTDMINGGGWRNLTSTGVNYLHLIAIVPLAMAFRVLDISDRRFDQLMQATIWLALVNSVVRFFVFDELRPGGPGLNPIPYGFVIAMWGTFVLARALEARKTSRAGLATSLAAVVPVLLTESKIVWAVMILAYLMVILWTAARRRRYDLLWKGAVVALPVLVIGYVTLAHRRLEMLYAEILAYLRDGTLTSDSFGYRFELLRVSYRAILDRPWFGHGISQRRTAAFAYAEEGGPDISGLGHLHNEYVTHMVALGVPGLLFVLAFLGFIVVVSATIAEGARRISGYALAAMLAVYMLTEVVFNMDPMSGAVTLALGFLLVPRDGPMRWRRRA